MARFSCSGGSVEGVPNKATADAKAFAEGLVDDPVYRAKLRRDLRARKVAPPIEQVVWFYACGKPKDVIALEGRLNLLDPDISDEDLIRRTRGVAGESQAARGEDGETWLIKWRRAVTTSCVLTDAS